MKKELINRIVAFRNERGWKPDQTAEALAKSLSIKAAHLLEQYQWTNQEKNIDEVKDDFADLLIYAVLFAEKYGFDIEKIIEEQIAKNEEKFPLRKK